jgi:hypothetical protein
MPECVSRDVVGPATTGLSPVRPHARLTGRTLHDTIHTVST